MRVRVRVEVSVQDRVKARAKVRFYENACPSKYGYKVRPRGVERVKAG